MQLSSSRARPFLAGLACLLAVSLVGPGVAASQGAPAHGSGELEHELGALEFRMVGPFRGGRSTTVTGHPDLLNTFWMGTSGGGLWRTENSGQTWSNLSDSGIRSGSIGAVEVSPTDLNMIWVGTGSGCPRGNIMNGDGMYRSLDGGATWQHLGLEDAGLIPRIALHPSEASWAYAAVLGDIFEPSATRGVYRTRDGGASWEQVLFVSEQTGAVDVAVDPFNPRVLFAAMWTAERKPWTLTDGSEEGGIWKSTDGGDTWVELTRGLPDGPVGRIGLAVSPAQRGRVWAHVTAPYGEGGVFRSDDGGASWSLVNGERKLQVRGWYYSHLEAHPTDADTVYSIGLRFHRSIDGGRTFTSIRTPHGDNHDLWIHPRAPETMVEANDGGANVTLDGGETWSSLHNQPTAELYRLTVDDGFPYRLYGAQQDNTSISVPAWGESPFAHEQDWWMPGGGESGHIAVHPDRPEIVYSGNYIGLLERWDRSTGERRRVLLYPELADGVPPRELTHRFQWNAPIRLSPHDPGTLYHTSHRVHRSRDEGASWSTITGDLSRDDEEKQALPGGPIQFDDTGVEVYGTVFAFEESALAAGELWAGTDDGRVHLSRDDGATWTEITPPDMEPDTTVNTIELSSHAAGRAYLAAHRYRLGDDRVLIWRTEDHGRTWERLGAGASGFEEGDFVRVVREHPEQERLLAAGAEHGLYVSLDRGSSWQRISLGLPPAQVADLAFAHGGLSVATHGRSFWVLDDVTPLVRLASASGSRPGGLELIEPRPAFWGVGSGRYSDGPQPDTMPRGATLYLWVGEDVPEGVAGTMMVRDAEGETVREIDLEWSSDDDDGLAPGLNRLEWDLRGERPETLGGSFMSLGFTGANLMPPGDYTVEVQLAEPVDDGEDGEDGEDVEATETWTATQQLEVRSDPRLGIDPDGVRAAYELGEQAKERMVEIHAVVGALRAVRDQLAELEVRLDKGGADYEEALAVAREGREEIGPELRALEDELIQSRAEAAQDALNFPPRLDNQYAFLYGQQVGMASRPNEGAYQRLDDLDRVWRPLQARWQEILDGPLAELNARLASAGVTPLLAVP